MKHLFHHRQNLAVVPPGDSQRERAHIVQRIFQRQFDGAVGLAICRHQPKRAGAEARVGIGGHVLQRFEGAVAHFVKGRPCAVAHREVGIPQGSGGALRRLEVEPGHAVGMAGRGEPKDAAGVVEGAVTAIHGIIPVGDEERAIRGHRDVAGTEVRVFPAAHQIGDDGGVAGTLFFHGERPDDALAGFGVKHLTAVFLRQQIAFVDHHPGRRAAAGDEQIGNDAGVVLVPHLTLHSVLHVGARVLVAHAGHLVGVTEVSAFHDVVDAAGAGAVVVVRLPENAEGIDGDLPVVAEVVAQHFDPAAVQLAAYDHPLPVGFSGVVNRIPVDVLDGRAVRMLQFGGVVAEIEIEPAVGPEADGVDGVVVLVLRPAQGRRFRQQLAPGTGPDARPKHRRRRCR